MAVLGEERCLLVYAFCSAGFAKVVGLDFPPSCALAGLRASYWRRGRIGYC